MTETEYLKQIEVLQRYNYEYHTLSDPSVSDAVYDSLLARVRAYEESRPNQVVDFSPTQRVGSEAAEDFVKVKHPHPMLGLTDVSNWEEVLEWMGRLRKLAPSMDTWHYFVDIKMDGLALNVVYEKGLFKQAITRGDGQVGEDVTSNARTISNLPLKLPKGSVAWPNRLDIRGEVIIYKQAFEDINRANQQAGRPLYANARNLAAGAMRLLDPKITATRQLVFRGYEILGADATSWQAIYEILSTAQITVNRQARLCGSPSDLKEAIVEMESLKDQLPYQTDGLVIKVDNYQLYQNLGSVARSPRAAVAYKFPPEEVSTKLLAINLQIGRTGVVTPVAVLEPIVLGGTLVQHASLHNADEIERLDVRLGDMVVLMKAGDIIPKIKSVLVDMRLGKPRRFNFSAELKRQHPDLKFERLEGEVAYRLADTAMTSDWLLVLAVTHYASRLAVNIEGLGMSTSQALVGAGLIEDVADIYSLTIEEVQKLPRFAKLSSQNLVRAIAKAKKPPLDKFIAALGIEEVGSRIALDLAMHFNNLSSLMAASKDDLIAVEGVGDVVGDRLVAYFANEDCRALLLKFQKLGVQPQPVSVSQNAPLAGLKFVVTGTFHTWSREALKQTLQSAGGQLQSRVSQRTDFLVLGQKPGGSKVARAAEYRTKTLDEQQLLDFLRLKT